MVVLVDPNVLLRLCTPGSAHHAESMGLVAVIGGRPHPFVVCAQVLIEFWVAATRPVERNGLRLGPDKAFEAVGKQRELFPCVPEPGDVADYWLRLVGDHKVIGKPAHDARLVALLRAHGISDLVTFNTGDFARYGHVRCHTPAEALRSK